MLTFLQTAVLLFIAVAGTTVVFTRDPTSQSIVMSFYGILLSVMFLIFQAPDVSLSQLTVGAVALPLMILLALAKIKKQANERKD